MKVDQSSDSKNSGFLSGTSKSIIEVEKISNNYVSMSMI